MKLLSPKLILLLSLVMNLGFSVKKNEYKVSCGPSFYADNSNSDIAPEINNVTISNYLGATTFYVCCGNDGYLGQFGGGGTFTIQVVVENDWNGGYGVASIGLRNYGGSIIDCKPYVYGTGTYTFSLPTWNCTGYEVFVSPTISCQ